MSDNSGPAAFKKADELLLRIALKEISPEQAAEQWPRTHEVIREAWHLCYSVANGVYNYSQALNDIEEKMKKDLVRRRFNLFRGKVQLGAVLVWAAMAVTAMVLGTRHPLPLVFTLVWLAAWFAIQFRVLPRYEEKRDLALFDLEREYLAKHRNRGTRPPGTEEAAALALQAKAQNSLN